MSDRPAVRQPRRRSGLLRVGRFYGVPLYFSVSWLVIALLLTVSYGPLIRQVVPTAGSVSSYVAASVFAVVFALCVLAHELGHTAISLALKRPVRRVVIFLLGGVSEIEHEPDRPRDEFFVSVAGPLVSLALGGVAAAARLLVGSTNLPGVVLTLLMWGNLVVAAFNLLPGLPLDGGRLLRALVWTLARARLNATRISAWGGRVISVVVAVSGILVNRDAYGITPGLITLVLAAYLWVGAGQSLRLAEVLDRAPSLSLPALLRPGLLVPPDVSIAEALRRAHEGNVGGLVVVDTADRPEAIVDERKLSAVPMQQRPWTAVSTVARPLDQGLVLPVNLSGTELLDAVRATPASEYLVVDAGGAPAGILSAADLASALRLRPA
jgi:Zn-dependent protease/CBS domain-containing protein